MGFFKYQTKLRSKLGALLPLTCLILSACNSQVSNTGAKSTASTSGTGLTNTSTGTTQTTSVQGPNAVQIILSSGSGGSFDNVTPPVTGGTFAPARRFYDLSGNQINPTTYPSWWFDTSTSGSGVFITSTSTSYPGGGTYATSSATSARYRTPCSYFDNFDDNNPETSGNFTIDGLVTNAPSLNDGTPAADMDQCAGATAGERAKLGMYFKFIRSNMLSTDKLQVIIRAKPLNTPNTAIVPSSCIVGGVFDATACSNAVFTVSMRTSLGAAARPFFMLMPSAKAMDLLSEMVLLPLHADPTITTVSIDRLKGGAAFYSITFVRIP